MRGGGDWIVHGVGVEGGGELDCSWGWGLGMGWVGAMPIWVFATVTRLLPSRVAATRLATVCISQCVGYCCWGR